MGEAALSDVALAWQRWGGYFASQIRAEGERPALVDRFNPGESHHRNYYNNDKYAADLRRASAVVAQRVKDLDLARPAEARPFEVVEGEDPSRRKNLTGKLYPLGVVSANGFIDARRRWKYPQSRPQGEKNGNGSGNGGNGPPITQRNPQRPPAAGGQSNPSPGSPANLRPRSGNASPTTGPSDSGRAGHARGRNRRRRRGKGNRGDQAPEVNIRLG